MLKNLILHEFVKKWLLVKKQYVEKKCRFGVQMSMTAENAETTVIGHADLALSKKIDRHGKNGPEVSRRSPDLFPSDCRVLFGPLKRHLGRTHLKNNGEVIKNYYFRSKCLCYYKAHTYTCTL